MRPKKHTQQRKFQLRAWAWFRHRTMPLGWGVDWLESFLRLIVLLALASCSGDPFVGAGDSSSGSAGTSSSGSAGTSSSGSAGTSSSGSSSSGSAGTSSSGSAGELGDCLKGWRGSICDTCTPAPAEPGTSCAVTLDCYEAEHCGPSGCSPACDYATSQTDHSVALAHDVYACRCQ